MRGQGIRSSSIRGSSMGPVTGTGGRAGMGDWWSDITSSVSNALNPSNWNLNPVYSPVYQSAVAPALNVAGSIVGTAVVGAPIPAGSLLTGILGGAPAPTPAQPYSPAYSAPIVAPAPATAATAAPAGGDNTMKYLLIAGLAGGIFYLATSPKPHAAA